MARSGGSSSSGGGIGLVSLVSGIYAYVTIPSLTGLKGAFAAAMTGMGTSLIAGLYLVSGVVLGAAVLGAGGALIGRAKEGAIAGAVICGLSAGLYGIPAGYGYAKDIVVNGTASKSSVSQVIQKPANDDAKVKIVPTAQLQKPQFTIAMPG